MPTYRIYDDLEILNGVFAGGAITQRLAGRFTYVATDGLVLSLTGTGFLYDAAGLPTAGTVTGFSIKQEGVSILVASDLSATLASIFLLVTGQSSGNTPVAPDPVTLMGVLFGGDDVYYGSGRDDDVVGRGGNDTFFGGLGDDWFAGGAGTDWIDGGGGWNGAYFHDQGASQGVVVDLNRATGQVLNDGFGNVETLVRVVNLDGSEWADRLTGNASDNRIWGHDGNDSLYGGRGYDDVYGGWGNDSVNGGAGDDWLGGGEGVDSLDGGEGINAATFYYDSAFQGAVVNLALSSGQVLDDGHGHAETLRRIVNVEGTRWGDVLTGGAAANSLWGDEGNDTLSGGAGNDGVYGGADDDSVLGGAGDDRLGGGSGIDSLDGGSGFNAAVFDYGDELEGAVVDLSRASGQVLNDGHGNVETLRRIYDLEGSRLGDSFRGDAAENIFWGHDGNDSLYGGGRDDTLYGGWGADFLFGGDGNDDLHGGYDKDRATGGAGADWFVFDGDGSSQHYGQMTIVDFAAVEDGIVLSLGWTGLVEGWLAGEAFLSGAGLNSAETADQRVIYDTVTGWLYHDGDGVGGEGSVAFARLLNLATISADDFYVSA